MAAYPPGPSRLFQLPDLAGGQAPGDLAYLVDVSLGTNAGDPSDVKSTLNDLFAEITKNITDLTVQFGNGVTGTVSAAGKGKLRYNDTAKSFQVSEDAGAYQNLLKGSGTATRVAFWSAADELSSDAALYWQNTDKRLGIGVGTTPDGPLDILADGTALAQQWRPNSGTMRTQMILDSGPETFLGTITAHNFHLITTNLQRLSIESGGRVGVNKPTGMAAQLHVISQDASTPSLFLQTANTPLSNIAEFYNDAGIRFTFEPSGILTLGKAGASGATGQLTFAVNGVAFTHTLRAGTSPAATNTYLWPNADPTAGQVLTASAPVAGVVTLSWGAAGSISGSGVATRVAFWSGTSTLSSDAAYYWDNTNKRLSVGVGTSPGAPIDVLAESVSAIAQQWRPNSGTMRAVIKLDGGPETFFGTSTAHNLHLITNSLQRLSIEDTSGNVGINKPTGIAAQLQVVANATTTVPLILNSAPSTSVNLAEFYNDASIRYTFDNSGILTLGKAGASGATGQLTFAVNGVAFTHTLRAGTSPAATNTYLWPNADPTAGQALTASAPAAGVVTLSWTTIAGGTTINPTDTVIPYRFNSTTFNDSPLSVASSAVTMTRSAIGSTSADGIVLLNATAAAAGAQQFSPRLRLTGSGWKTTATAAAQVVDWAIETQPVQGTTAPTANLAFLRQINAGGYASQAQFTSAGGLQLIAPTSRTSVNVGIISQVGGIAVDGSTAVSMQPNSATVSIAQFVSTGLWLASSSILCWSTSSTDPAAVNPNLCLVNHATSVLRVADSRPGVGTGAGSVLIGTSTDSVTGNFTVLSSNAATNSLVTVARLGVNSTGTAADGFGASLSWSAETSTTNDTETGRINVFWTTATHASRTSAISWSVVNNATLAPIMRLGTPSNNVGSPFVLTIHEGTNPNVWTNGSYAAKLYLITTSIPAVGVAAHFSATALDAPQWQMLRGRGTNASPTAVQSADSIGNIEWWGQTSTSTNNVVAGARIRVSATENWSAGNNGCQMIFFTSNNAGTITDRMYLKETGTLRIGATSGSYDTTNLLQVGNYASFSTGVTAAIYSGANSTIGLRLIGTNGQTANMLEIFRDSLTPNLLTLAASGVLSLRAGLNTGTTVAKVGGTIHEDFTPVSNSGTGETDLMTYSVPANTLGTDNDYLEVEAFGEFTAPTGNATVKMKFGAATIFNTSALAFTTGAWRLRARIVRGGATSQLTITSFDGDTTLVTVTAQVAAPAETLSGAVTLKCTGQSGASSEVTQEGFIVKWQPASN